MNVVDRPRLPVSVLSVLVTDADVEVRRRAAGHADMTEELLTLLAQGRSEKVWAAITDRDGGRQWIALHPDETVRAHAAAVVGPSSAEFAMLLNDLSPKVRLAAAKAARDNQQLSRLVKDSDVKVRVVVAQRLTDTDALNAMVTDRAWQVRRAVVGNRAASAATIGALAADSVEAVRVAAAEKFMSAMGA
jgi:hypothetical protein